MCIIEKKIICSSQNIFCHFQDIRWCKSVSGQYQVISLQDTPQTQIESQREDGCTYVQKSEIFYHITEEDNDLDIMCELEYIKNSKICGKGRFNSTLRISTHLKGMIILILFLLFNQMVLYSLTLKKMLFRECYLNKNNQEVKKNPDNI